MMPYQRTGFWECSVTCTHSLALSENLLSFPSMLPEFLPHVDSIIVINSSRHVCGGYTLSLWLHPSYRTYVCGRSSSIVLLLQLCIMQLRRFQFTFLAHSLIIIVDHLCHNADEMYINDVSACGINPGMSGCSAIHV